MIGKSSLDIAYEAILKDVAVKLGSDGFARRGRSLRREFDEGVEIIEFQKSRGSSSKSIIFTVNVGVAFKKLLPPRTNMGKIDIIDAHLNERIGMLLSTREDTWWTLSERADSGSLADEIYKLILNRALPYLEKHRSIQSMAELWESGTCPGLTVGQCERLLSRLRG